MTTLTPSEQSAPDPIEYIKAEMLRRRLKRSDLEHAFGSRSKTAEVLNRKRGISLAMIRRLVFNHGFNAEKLIGGDYDFRNQKTDDALSKLEAGTHVLVPVEPTGGEVDNACLSFIHSFVLMNDHAQERYRREAKEWLRVWVNESRRSVRALLQASQEDG